MKKKCILLFCLCFSVVVLAGCDSGSELTTEERDKIAEYSAGILLQHYGKYSRRLIRQEAAAPDNTELPAAATPVPVEDDKKPVESNETPEDGDQEENLREVSLDDLYHVAGMNVRYRSYAVCKEYPKKTSSFQLTAKKGHRLVVVQFDLKNTAKKLVKVNLGERQIDYLLDADGATYKPTIAIQKNGGMNYLDTKLKPGQSEKAILVFEIPKNSAPFGSAVLTIKEGDSASTVRLK